MQGFVIVVLSLVFSCASNGLAAEVDLSKHPNLSLLPPPGTCGQPGLAKTLSTVKHDGHMQNATLGLFPFVALLAYPENGKLNYKCLGTLISKRHVLTNFACISRQIGGLPVSVRFGYVNASDETNCINTVCHPPQDVAVRDVTVNGHHRLLFRNDIVLLHLAADVAFNEFVQPVCLPIDRSNLTEATVYSYMWRTDQARWRAEMAYQMAPVGAAYGKLGEAEMMDEADVDILEPEPSSTTPSPCTSRRCKRRRETGLLQYSADIIVEKLECLTAHAYGATCDDCQYSLKSTICIEMEETKDYCRREAGSPIVYAVPSLEKTNSNNTAAATPTFYLAGILQHDVTCYRTVAAVATSAHDLVKWILDHLSYCMKI